MWNTMRKIDYKTNRQERSFGKVDIERKKSCGTWRVFYDLGEETNPRTKFGGIEQSTRRGGILCLIVISLCPLYFWFSHMIYRLCSTFIEMIGYMLLMLCLVHWYNLYTITTSMLLTHEQSSPHTLMYLVDIYIMLPLSLLSCFTKYLLKFSYACVALDMLW